MNSSAKARVRDDFYYGQRLQEYATDPINQTQVIEGYFYKENILKEMAIRKVNMTLCSILAFFVVGAFVSYYFAMSNEITLNTLSRQVTALNDENSELQNQLDRLKSFNNVDNMMAQQNILQKAAKVIEVPKIASAAELGNKKKLSLAVDWSIGY
ncbi:MAG: hypothetical protein VZR09_00725 [Candidatus Gastranaerophilaceae bacterium]|nr:hypothetical protein [Candidatus Gastranaerophilaceae bacterium]